MTNRLYYGDNLDADHVNRATKDGPVMIAEGGVPTYVLMTIADYEMLNRGEQKLPLVEFLEGLGLDGLDVMRPRSTEAEG